MKTLRFIGMAFIAVVLSMSIYSCDDDDDDNGGGGGSSSSPKSDVSVITTKDGERLLLESVNGGSKWNTISFNYDSQGRCTSDSYQGLWTLSMSYDPYKIVMDTDVYDDYSTELSFNSSGYISKVNFEVYDDDYDERDSESDSFSYDSNGHLTKISGSVSGSWTEDGVKYSGSGTSDMTVTWENGDITKVVRNGKEKANGYTYEYQETFTYEYGSTENEYQQYTLAITEMAYEWLTDYTALALIGYFGKGPTHLPTSCKAVYEDDETYSETYSYTKNSDGSIKTEKVNNGTYNYTYASLDDDTRSAKSTYEDVLSTQWNTNVERKHTLGFRSKFLKRHNSQK